MPFTTPLTATYHDVQSRLVSDQFGSTIYRSQEIPDDFLAALARQKAESTSSRSSEYHHVAIRAG